MIIDYHCTILQTSKGVKEWSEEVIMDATNNLERERETLRTQGNREELVERKEHGG
jgi:hypothetical protein